MFLLKNVCYLFYFYRFSSVFLSCPVHCYRPIQKNKIYWKILKENSLGTLFPFLEGIIVGKYLYGISIRFLLHGNVSFTISLREMRFSRHQALNVAVLLIVIFPLSNGIIITITLCYCKIENLFTVHNKMDENRLKQTKLKWYIPG